MFNMYRVEMLTMYVLVEMLNLYKVEVLNIGTKWKC